MLGGLSTLALPLQPLEPVGGGAIAEAPDPILEGVFLERLPSVFHGIAGASQSDFGGASVALHDEVSTRGSDNHPLVFDLSVLVDEPDSVPDLE